MFGLLSVQNEQLRQDVVDYQKQIDSQKETISLRRGEDSDYRSQLSRKNFELVQYLDEIQVKSMHTIESLLNTATDNSVFHKAMSFYRSSHVE